MSAQVYEGFAEALVAALDLREHETGLHSKRVACHTLVPVSYTHLTLPTSDLV